MLRLVNAIRSILFNLVFYSFTIVYCLAILPVCLTPGTKGIRAGIYGYCKGSLFIARWVMGIKVRYDHPERLPKEGGVILASAHQSYMDPIMAYMLRQDVTALAKKELFKTPLIGQLIAKMGVIKVDRQSGKAHKGMADVSKQVAEKGLVMIVYPQATRVPIGETRKLKPGAFFMQEQGNLPVIPVATTTGVYWTKGFWHRAGTAVYHVGEPIPAGLSKDEFMKRLQENVVDKSHALVEEAGHGNLLK